MSEDRGVFNQVQLQEKNIEPSTKNQDFLNRNFQLGNIQSNTFVRLAYQLKRAIEFDNFPINYGGFLTKQYALEKHKMNEGLLVMSGSIKGFVRESNNTVRSDQKLEQSSKNAFSGMFAK
jgi:hypothetical protein